MSKSSSAKWILWNSDFSLQFLKFLYEENFLIEVGNPHQEGGKKTKLSPVEKWSSEKDSVFTPVN